MKFTTFAILAAVTAVVSAAPTPEAARGDNRGHRHGHKYGGQRKYGHSHKQPHADAPATTDEWNEDEPCVGGISAPVAANAVADSASSISSASSVTSASTSSTSESSSSTEEPAPSTTESPKAEPTPEWKAPPKDEDVQVEQQASNNKPEEPPKNEGGNNGGTSNGGRHGQITTYSVTNPAENHGADPGTVACYTLNRQFSNSDYIAAVRNGEFHIGLCGKTINVCGKAGCVDVQIVDSCAGGGCKDLDLSPSAFQAVTGDNTGIYDVTIQGF